VPSLPADAKLLVISVARIGDTVLTTPVMRALKAACPAGRLSVMAHPSRREALEHLPFIDELGALDKSRVRWKGRWSRPAHDVAVVFGRDAPLLDYALRVAHRVCAYDEPAFRGLSAARAGRLSLVSVEEGHHAVRDRLRLIEPLGIDAADPRLAYRVTSEEAARARAMLARRWPRPGGPLVGLQMSSFPTKSHRDWPVASFGDLAERIADGHPDVRFVVLGDAYARASAAPFIERHAARALLAAGETRLREAAALIAALDLYVGVDTGPTHIAGALGVPMVALYHCLYPGRLLAPLDHPHCRVIEHPLTGSADCAASGMEKITVEVVHRAADELLRTQAPRSARA
jgi:heptosyltransferase-3